MKTRSVYYSLFISFFTAIMLSACGGGGDSDSGASTTNTTDLAGTYNGTGTVTLTGGGTSASASGSVTVIIAANGAILYKENGSTLATGTLNVNKFTLTYSGSVANQTGITCTGLIHVAGTVTGSQIAGTYSDTNFICNGIGIRVSGSFTATKGSAKAANSSGIPQVRKLVQKLN